MRMQVPLAYLLFHGKESGRVVMSQPRATASNSWIFVKDNLLLQINGDVPEAVAKQYGKALDLRDEQ